MHVKINHDKNLKYCMRYLTKVILLGMIFTCVNVSAQEWHYEKKGGINPQQPIKIGETIYHVKIGEQYGDILATYSENEVMYQYVGVEEKTIKLELIQKTILARVMGAGDTWEKKELIKLPLDFYNKAYFVTSVLPEEQCDYMVITLVNEQNHITVEKANSELELEPFMSSRSDSTAWGG